MKGGDQGRALPADGDVAAAEVRHGGNAGAGGDAVRVADLDREPQRPGGRMEHGLPVAADRRDCAGRKLGLLEQPASGVGECFTELRIELAELGEGAAPIRMDEGLESLPQSRGQGGAA